MKASEVKEALTKKAKNPPSGPLLSTGSTLVNLAVTGQPEGGWLAGRYFFFVGDSDSGKSWFMHTALAEASINPVFDEYRLIYDNTEHKGLMDVERYFGKRLAERIEPPRRKDGEPIFSHSTEEFYYHMDDAFEAGRPFIYILDSQDSLTSARESAKFDKLKAKSRGKKSETADGDYSDGKAKSHSSNLRQFIGPLAETGSILIVVNQSRDSFSMFNPDAHSGGRALKFYAVAQLWTYNIGTVTRTYRGKKRQQGIRSKVRVKKNHITGKLSEVEVPILHSSGIDEIGSMVDYLVSEGTWKKSDAGVITVTGLGPEKKLKREPLVREIESGNMEEDVRELVVETWRDIEKACEVPRKLRYE